MAPPTFSITVTGSVRQLNQSSVGTSSSLLQLFTSLHKQKNLPVWTIAINYWYSLQRSSYVVCASRGVVLTPAAVAIRWQAGVRGGYPRAVGVQAKVWRHLCRGAGHAAGVVDGHRDGLGERKRCSCTPAITRCQKQSRDDVTGSFIKKYMFRIIGGSVFPQHTRCRSDILPQLM